MYGDHSPRRDGRIRHFIKAGLSGLLLFDITGVSVDAGSVSFEHRAGAAHCCPTAYVTQTFRWTDGRFVLAGEKRRPWKGK
jgi:hypothetical protein